MMVAVPNLDQLAREPGCARGASGRDDRSATGAMRCRSRGLACALVSSGQAGKGQPAEIRLPTVVEAATRLGVTREWFYRRGKRLGLAVKLGDGTLRFSSVALDAYINGLAISAAPPSRRRRRIKLDSGDLTD
jgi:hypothetical protein